MQLPPLFQYVATELCENGLRAVQNYVKTACACGPFCFV
ncbi:hypothetical protein LTSEJOH_0823 [Salmonella enterica subsp. enterica serovar Johannesburg str. S5-703]|uniref:Uncharacterized protein n=1 Tax=Salmonella enterica subsp. enterica serovar Uganda str. R8-3404 TaxID=913083 RepID=A0A6C8H600_SALET|nr:hypothetical protein LTSEJOH_0823 [Salmonella enterica subsp. enterica serovar Johannesburg str. S5-703]EHC95625.1 hypothetical protein LTSEUGA_0715 [Salmonella enterica subsp. enterica serovar Uganda str. R8-3404]